MVVHHSEGGWTGELAFEALLDVDPDLFDLIAPHVPRFRFLLEDLSSVSEEALQRRAMSALGRLALWCLKNARTPEEIVRRMRGWADLVREVARAPNGIGALVMIFRYIFLVSERLKPDELRELLTGALGEEGKETMASAADQLRAEGERKGRAEERRELLLKLLGLRFGELPKEVRERVNAAEPTMLETWVERVLFAQTLNEVLKNT